MSNLNKVQIIGRTGKDTEVRYTPNGKAVASLSVAVSEKWKDQQGQQQESTEWFNVSMFGRLAEIAGEYVKKGDLIYLEGKQRTEKWQDQQGNDRYTTKMIANQMQMLGSKNQQSNQNGYQQPAQQQSAQPPSNQNAAPDFDFDQDIPF